MSRASDMILLDTCIVLELARGNDTGRRIGDAYELVKRPYPPMISIVTLGELLAFARHKGWGSHRESQLRQIVSKYVVVDIGQPVVERYAEIAAFLVANGRSVSNNDNWIAATAAAYNALLITTDKDFEPLREKHIRLSRFDVAMTRN